MPRLPIWEIEPKYCEDCGDRIIPKYNVSVARWRTRVRFCGRSCVTRTVIGGWNEGSPMPEETKDKMRASIAASGGRAGRRNPMYGKKRPDVAAMNRSPEQRAAKRKRMLEGGAAKARAAQGGRVSSIERTMAYLLEQAGFVFKHGVPIGPYEFDFIIGDLVVECDGDYWHSLPGVKERDAEKDEFLSKQGYRILRLTETEIQSDPVECYLKVADACGR